MQKQQMDAQTKMQLQQMQAQQQTAKLQMEAQINMKQSQAVIAFEIEKLKNEAQLKEKLMQVEFVLNLNSNVVSWCGLESKVFARISHPCISITTLRRSATRRQVLNSDILPEHFKLL